MEGTMNYGFFMARALEEAEQALSEGEFPVGCVMVHEGAVIATGARHRTRPDNGNEVDHAEMLALRRLANDRQTVNREEVTVFSTLEPCLMCYAALIINGIRRVVYAYEDVMGGGTGLDLTRLNPIYAGAAMVVVPHVLRKESLSLFKKFFSDPNNTYLQGTLLAKHALSQ
jgi:tRNA(adenine34) deaminase